MLQMRSGRVLVGRRQIWDGEGAHMKIRGERVDDLVGAHMGVGVDDTLAAALHGARCVESDGCNGEGEGRLRTGGPSNVGWTWGEILEVRLRWAVSSAVSSSTPELAPHYCACLLDRGEASSAHLCFCGQLAFD